MANGKDSYENNPIKNAKELLNSDTPSFKDILMGGKRNTPKEGQSRAELETERGGRHDIEKEGTCFDAAGFRKKLEADRQDKSSTENKSEPDDKPEPDREHD